MQGLFGHLFHPRAFALLRSSAVSISRHRRHQPMPRAGPLTTGDRGASGMDTGDAGDPRTPHGTELLAEALEILEDDMGKFRPLGSHFSVDLDVFGEIPYI